jgi:hypothetical protein
MKINAKKHIVYFATFNAEIELLKKLGFQYIGEYKYFKWAKEI